MFIILIREIILPPSKLCINLFGFFENLVCRLGFLPQHKVYKNNQVICNKKSNHMFFYIWHLKYETHPLFIYFKAQFSRKYFLDRIVYLPNKAILQSVGSYLINKIQTGQILTLNRPVYIIYRIFNNQLSFAPQNSNFSRFS